MSYRKICRRYVSQTKLAREKFHRQRVGSDKFCSIVEVSLIKKSLAPQKIVERSLVDSSLTAIDLRQASLVKVALAEVSSPQMGVLWDKWLCLKIVYPEWSIGLPSLFPTSQSFAHWRCNKGYVAYVRSVSFFSVPCTLSVSRALQHAKKTKSSGATLLPPVPPSAFARGKNKCKLSGSVCRTFKNVPKAETHHPRSNCVLNVCVDQAPC